MRRGSLALAREVQSQKHVADARSLLGGLARRRGDSARAPASYCDGMLLHQWLGCTTGRVQGLDGAATCALRLGRLDDHDSVRRGHCMAHYTAVKCRQRVLTISIRREVNRG